MANLFTSTTIKIIHYIKINKFSFIFGLFIFSLALYLRAYKVDQYMTFLGDEGRDALILLRLFKNFDIPFLGPTASVGGFFLGPFYYYLIAPFFFLAGLSPVGPSLFIAFIGSLTVLTLFYLLKFWYQTWIAILVSLLYATSPVLIAMSRSSWNPNPVPFVSLILLILLSRLRETSSSTHLVLIGLLCGIGIQLHYLYLFVIVTIGVWLIVFKRESITLAKFLSLMLGFTIPLVPFIGFEVKNRFLNFRAIIEFLSIGKDTGIQNSVFLAHILQVPFQLYGRFLFLMPDIRELSKIPSLHQNIFRYGIWSLVILTVGSIAFRFYKEQTRSEANKRNSNYSLLLVWFIVPLLLFGFYKKDIYDYYLGILTPIPFIALAEFLNIFSRNKLIKGFIIVCGAVLLLLNWQRRPFLYAPNNQYKQAETIARSALSMVNGGAFNFALISNGNSDHVYRFFFEKWNRIPTVLENIEKDPNRNSVTNTLIVICEVHPCNPLGHPLWEIAGFGRAEISAMSEVPFVTIYRLMHYKGN